jgi:hypothetical protein
MLFVPDVPMSPLEMSGKKSVARPTRLYDNCTNEEHKSMLAPYIYVERFIDDILSGIDKKYHIDPAITSFFCHLTEWGKQSNEPPIVIYDESKQLQLHNPFLRK